ncbi:MAG: ROK family protein [Dehalococcoidia bacterium]|nr:ROK family protein [Dehalococcoidia bacterium]
MPASEPQSEGVIAVDLGGTRLRVAVYDAGGVERHHDTRLTPPGEPEALAQAIVEAKAATSAELRLTEAVVGVPGWVDYRSNRAVALPNLPAWGSIDGTALSSETGLRVVFGNDADFAALGEHRFGAGRGTTDLVYVTCSTGIGAGVVLGGRLVRSHRSIAEIGHTVIDWRTDDTVEGLGSGTSLARVAGMPAEVVAARAAAGDETAARQFHDAAEALAVGALNMAFLFGPERIVIGGGMAAAGDLLLGPVRERFARERSPLLDLRPEDVVLAEQPQGAGLAGAFAFWDSEVRAR